MIGIKLSLRTLEQLDRYCGAHGWSRALGVRKLLDRSLEAELPDFVPAPPPIPRPRRTRGRPKGSTGLQQAEPRPLATPLPHEPRPLPPSSPRNEAVVTAYASGKTIGEVAALHGITPQRVAQIVRRHGRRLTRAARKKEATAIAAKTVNRYVKGLVKQADELIAAETKPTPGPSVEPIPVMEPIVDLIPPPNVAELLPDMPADSSVDDLLAAAEREIERRMAPKAEPEFESASYDSPGLLQCEKEWLARVLPGGLTPETSAQLTGAFYMAKAAKIPRGSPRYFQFMTLRCGLTNK